MLLDDDAQKPFLFHIRCFVCLHSFIHIQLYSAKETHRNQTNTALFSLTICSDIQSMGVRRDREVRSSTYQTIRWYTELGLLDVFPAPSPVSIQISMENNDNTWLEWNWYIMLVLPDARKIHTIYLFSFPSVLLSMCIHILTLSLTIAMTCELILFGVFCCCCCCCCVTHILRDNCLQMIKLDFIDKWDSVIFNMWIGS